MFLPTPHLSKPLSDLNEWWIDLFLAAGLEISSRRVQYEAFI